MLVLCDARFELAGTRVDEHRAQGGLDRTAEDQPEHAAGIDLEAEGRAGA